MAGPAQYAQANMNATDFQNVFNTQTQAGYAPVNISVASVNGAKRFDALFEKRPPLSIIALAEVPIADYQAVFP